ncbi:cation:proton antiporter [Actinophytocola gossypii]|uniref:Cation:proton antiporter n=1 Tax=Actinophytocola gossypii TaxID=2812003 RepID=A0ABT2J948_9PSEU|nr:cation:proton antiporter [Actinophytocola gossypii]MCT2584384.1 cation:proton antiporter [Actinophytocola gossypii]
MTDPGSVVYAAAGLATLAAALLPRLLGRIPVSMPMIFLAVGAVAFALIEPLPDPLPMEHANITLRLTELCVIVSLMGAGLALDRRVGRHAWSTTWRLLGVTMPITMVGLGLLGWSVLGFGVAGAVLLAAALAPTDPVLASEVQVGEPAQGAEEETEDEPRFALTSEAGLNDGLAFPFTYAAIAISGAGLAPGGWLAHWLAVDVLWRVGGGLLVGLVAGWGLRKLFFRAESDKLRLAEHAEGFVALAATFLTYGVAELVHGYGFVAVFVCACTIRAAERSHGYHRVLHTYVEQLERLLTVLVIFLLGGAVTRGLLAGLTWEEVLVALVALLVVRPVAGLLALLGGRAATRERVVVSFFGVRGVGSVFYVAYAVEHGDFLEAGAVWRIVALVVVGSIVVHGLSASPVMAFLDRKKDELDDRHEERQEGDGTWTTARG